MLDNFANMIAAFTAPEHIGTTPYSILWMFPLLASVSIIYKATKLRVIFVKKFVKEVAILFLTLSLFMIGVAVLLYFVVWFVTG
ncbi:MAG: hypothetical protein KAJ07_11145 [Planctomycetes bacterium]|nr:hypothetical protein [Planctomycetota bacterium]